MLSHWCIRLHRSQTIREASPKSNDHDQINGAHGASSFPQNNHAERPGALYPTAHCGCACYPVSSLRTNLKRSPDDTISETDTSCFLWLLHNKSQRVSPLAFDVRQQQELLFKVSLYSSDMADIYTVKLKL